MTDSTAFQEERKVLETVNLWIDQYEKKNNPENIPVEKTWQEYGGADEHTAFVFRTRAQAKWMEFRRIVNSPYFGRLDYSENDNRSKSIYIGYLGFDTDSIRVIDWRSPVASLFYRNGQDNGNQPMIYAPGGAFRAELNLKRRIDIRQRELIHIIDEFDLKSKKLGGIDNQISKDILRNALAKRGNPNLQDIVRTIQEHQDLLIRSKPDQILIINGVAGSGKTSVAYHRIAYLVFPDSKTDIDPAKIIVFGPNRLFLSYVEKLLPSIGVKNIAQTTFDDWALESMRLIERNKEGQLYKKVKVTDRALAVFLDPSSTRSDRVVHWRRAKLKGSLRFGDLLARYIDYEKKSFRVPIADYNYVSETQGESIPFSITKEEIVKVYNQIDWEGKSLISGRSEFAFLIKRNIDGRLEEEIRNYFINRKAPLLKELEGAKLAHDYISISDTQKKIKEIENTSNRIFSSSILMRNLKDKIYHRYLDDLQHLWPTQQLIPAYQNLLSNADLMEELGKGLFSEEEIRLINSIGQDPNSIDLEDISGLFYLYFLLYGWGGKQFDHIVVDEGQDFSPLQYKILRSINKNGSLTIVGDTSQGIIAHRGISEWNEIRNAMPDDEVNLCEILQNYRSTSEIVQFTNAVLKITGKNKCKLAIPIDRHGDKPAGYICKSIDEIYHNIHFDINKLRKNGIQNIGVIVKTSSECEYVYKRLKNVKGINIGVLNNRDEIYDYEGGAVVIPVALSKGLEFEAVLIFDASSEKYDPAIEYDGRLFYVAVTRALHHLSLYSIHEMTAYAQNEFIVLHKYLTGL